jgi:hypothetical protein
MISCCFSLFLYPCGPIELKNMSDKPLAERQAYDII